MQIIEHLSVDSKFPFLKVLDFHFFWRPQEHAVFELNGYLDVELFKNKQIRDYKNTELKVIYKKEVLFFGLIKELALSVNADIYSINVTAVSASWKLDQDCCGEMFQDCSLTYEEMVRRMADKQSGQVICTIGQNESIKKPLLCYGETVWEWSKRMASHLHKPVIADIKTCMAAFWFGIPEGEIINKHELTSVRIELKKSFRQDKPNKISYLLESGISYDLGDRLYLNGSSLIIYEKEAYLELGEVKFIYTAANEEGIYVDEYTLDRIAGLSLKGTVRKVEKELVYMELDLDGKQGEYGYSWYPITGNVLYAMPEIGAKVELYFMSADEREAIAIQCRDTKESNPAKKMLKTDQAEMMIDSSKIRFYQENELVVSDGAIAMNGEQALEISAAGRIKIEAKTIEITAPNEIKAVTE